MSEAMTTEMIAEAQWLLKGYWTKVRFPFRTSNGGWSDVDVLAYDPETRHLVICESKVRGPKSYVYAYTRYTAKSYGNIFRYDGENYLGFINRLDMLCRDGVIFVDFKKMVSKLSVQLVSNYFISAEIRSSVGSVIEKRVRRRVPRGIQLEILTDTTIDVLAEIIEQERLSEQGRRYGHPVMDIAREINRYVIGETRYAGRDQDSVRETKREILEKFLRAINLRP